MSNTESQPLSPPAAARPALLSSGNVVAAMGMLAGLYLVISSRAFPSGLGSLPGPGFFPLCLGLLIVAFSLAIAWGQRRPAPVAPSSFSRSWTLPLATTALVLLWILTWDTVPYFFRTPLLVAALMRLSGASWRAAAVAAITFSAVVYGIFQLGLRVDLG